MKRGFSLVEMLVVVGIIAILISALLGGYAGVTRAAEKKRCQELVDNTRTALTALFQDAGAWPKALRSQDNHNSELDEKAAYPLAKGDYLSLSSKGGKLSGHDRFGVITPWGLTHVKRRGDAADLGDKVKTGGTLKDHILHYALDLDGDGIIEGVSVGGESIDIRATAAVWCGGKDGKIEPYSKGLKGDDVYSWTHGQTQKVK